jgi:hypothetical protein
LNYPGASFTNVTAVEGPTVVGYYTLPGAFQAHGFIHDLGSGSWTTLDFPGASTTAIWDMSNGILVGDYATTERGFGFIFDQGAWRTIDIPGSIGTTVTAIDGIWLAGGYFNDPTPMRGFIAAIPEPASGGVLLLAVCLFAMARGARGGLPAHHLVEIALVIPIGAIP